MTAEELLPSRPGSSYVISLTNRSFQSTQPTGEPLLLLIEDGPSADRDALAPHLDSIHRAGPTIVVLWLNHLANSAVLSLLCRVNFPALRCLYLSTDTSEVPTDLARFLETNPNLEVIRMRIPFFTGFAQSVLEAMQGRLPSLLGLYLSLDNASIKKRTPVSSGSAQRELNRLVGKLCDALANVVSSSRRLERFALCFGENSNYPLNTLHNLWVELFSHGSLMNLFLDLLDSSHRYEEPPELTELVLRNTSLSQVTFANRSTIQLAPCESESETICSSFDLVILGSPRMKMPSPQFLQAAHGLTIHLGGVLETTKALEEFLESRGGRLKRLEITSPNDKCIVDLVRAVESGCRSLTSFRFEPAVKGFSGMIGYNLEELYSCFTNVVRSNESLEFLDVWARSSPWDQVKLRDAVLGHASLSVALLNGKSLLPPDLVGVTWRWVLCAWACTRNPTSFAVDVNLIRYIEEYVQGRLEESPNVYEVGDIVVAGGSSDRDKYSLAQVIDVEQTQGDRNYTVHFSELKQRDNREGARVRPLNEIEWIHLDNLKV